TILISKRFQFLSKKDQKQFFDYPNNAELVKSLFDRSDETMTKFKKGAFEVLCKRVYSEGALYKLFANVEITEQMRAELSEVLSDSMEGKLTPKPEFLSKFIKLRPPLTIPLD